MAPRVQRVPPGPPVARGLFELYAHYRELQRDVLGTLGQRFATYGDFYYAEVLGQPVYTTCDPEVAHAVLVTQASDFGKRRRDLDVLGDGLLLSEGEYWRTQRRRIQPGFRRESLERYALVIDDEVERLCARIGSGERFDLRAVLMELTLRVVCRALFGRHYSGNARRLARAMETLQEEVLRPKLVAPWLPTPAALVRRHHRAVVDREAYALIDADHHEPGSLLAELLALVDDEGRMSRQALRDEVVTLLLAGHETTALALTWAFYLVALHPSVDEALAAELQAKARPGAPLGPDELEALTLTERVLKETLRLYPPVYAIPRVVRRPVKLGGYWLPVGAEVWLWTYFMQRDPRWFSLPERFVPERFAPGGEASRAPRAYLPFGAGTRSCIGRHFANLEATIVLARVLSRYRLELVDSRPVWTRPRVTLAPARPIFVRARPRGSR